MADDRTGSAEQTLSSVTQSGTASAPSKGVISQTLLSPTQALIGTFAPGTDTGSITQSLGFLTQSGTATYTPPTATGSISQTLGVISQVGTATFEAGNTGVIGQTLPKITQSGTADWDVGTDTGVITQTLPKINQSGTGLVPSTGVINQSFTRSAYATSGVEIGNPLTQVFSKTTQWWGSGDGTKMTFAMWLKCPAPIVGRTTIVVSSSSRPFQLSFDNWDDTNDDDHNRFYVKFVNNSVLGYAANTLGFATHGIAVGDWFALMGSCDYTAPGVPPVVKIWIQKQGSTTAVDITPVAPFINDLGPRTFLYQFSGTIYFGYSSYGSEAPYYLSEFFYDGPNYAVDWSSATERGKYVNTYGYPKYLGVQGTGITGLRPRYYCPNGFLTSNLGTGGLFTNTGSIGASPDSPTTGSTPAPWYSQSGTAKYWDYGGFIEQTLPSLTQIGWGPGYYDFGGPIVQTLPKITQSGTAHYEPGTSTASIVQTLPLITQSIIAWHWIGWRFGPISQTLRLITQSGTAVSWEGLRTGSIAQTLKKITQSGTAHYEPGISTGSISQTLRSITQTAEGIHLRFVQGAANQSLRKITQSGTAHYERGTKSGWITNQRLPSISQSLQGKVYVKGVIAQTLGRITQQGNATIEPGASVGVIVQTLSFIEQALIGSRIRSGAVAQTLPHIGQQLTGTYSVGISTGSVLQVLGKLQQSGTAHYEPGTSTGFITQNLTGITQQLRAVTFIIRPTGSFIWEVPDEELIWEQPVNELVWERVR